MCNYNGVCPISNGCGYYHFAYCCQRRQCMPCCNRARLVSKAAATTGNVGCLAKRAKAKNGAPNCTANTEEAKNSETNNATENPVSPKSTTTTGVCRARCVAPCSVQHNGKTKKMHYPSGPLQRRRPINPASPNAQCCPLTQAAPTSTNKIVQPSAQVENCVVEVAKAKKKSKLHKQKPKKNEAKEESADDRTKSGEDGLWFQCNVPVRVNVPNLMVMQPASIDNETKAIGNCGRIHCSGSNPTKKTNALSVFQNNFHPQPTCTGQAMPFFCVYFKQAQDAIESPKKSCNEIQTQTHLPEAPNEIANLKSPPQLTNCSARRRRTCRCAKRKGKMPIEAPPGSSSTTQMRQRSHSSYEFPDSPLSPTTSNAPRNNDCVPAPNTSRHSLSQAVDATRATRRPPGEFTSKRSVEFLDSNKERKPIAECNDKPTDLRQTNDTSDSESNKSLRKTSSDHITTKGDLNKMVQRDLNDLYRICKCLEAKKYCPKADRQRSCVSLYAQNNRQANESWHTTSQSLNNLPTISRCPAMKSKTKPQIEPRPKFACNIRRKTCCKCAGQLSTSTRSTITKNKPKSRQSEISPSSSCNSNSGKWQPVVQLIEDIVADNPPKGLKASISHSTTTLTTPTPSCCSSCPKCAPAKRKTKKKTAKAAGYYAITGGKQGLRSEMTTSESCQYLSCEHCVPTFGNSESRLKAALDKRPVVLVPYQVTTAHEPMPVCESKNVYAMCIPCTSTQQLSCSQMKCNKDKNEEADHKCDDNDDDDDNGESEYNQAVPIHTTAILMPRPMNSDSNIRPPSYCCSQPNRHEASNYAKTVLYETTTVCSLQNLIQACSRPPSNLIGCTFMAKDKFPDTFSHAKQRQHPSHDSLPNHRKSMDIQPTEVGSVGKDFNEVHQIPPINSNNQCNTCPCCRSFCRYSPQMMMPSSPVQNIPVGFYQQTAQKYGIDIMDSFFRNQPPCSNCCQMHHNQARQHAGHYHFATVANGKSTACPTQTRTEPVAVNSCPYGGHCFR